MKNSNKWYILLLALTFNLGSCELEPEIFDELSSENFPQTDIDVEASITDIYKDLNSAWSPKWLDHSHWILNILTTDELTSAWTGQWQTIDRLAWDANLRPLRIAYHTYSKSITKATLIIGNLENTDLTGQETKQRLLAEAKTLRAFYAFTLLDLFGPVPIIVDYDDATSILTANLSPERPTEQWMVDFITEELNAAVDYLPEQHADGDFGRITKGAALAILMKLQLHQKNWEGVLDSSHKIMNLNYALMPDYNSIFDHANEGYANTESIFVIPKLATDGLGTSWFAVVLPQTPRYQSPTGLNYSIWGGLKTPWPFYDTFEEGTDTRLNRMVRYYEDVDGNQVDFRLVQNNKAVGAAPKKFGDDPNHQGNQQGNDVILLRLADVLLARAEALNETNSLSSEAQDLIMQIRDRAAAGEIPSEALTSQSSLRDFILEERGRELWCEGQRRQDLIRHGKFISKATTDGFSPSGEHLVLFPIPQSVRDENPNIGQNPGY